MPAALVEKIGQRLMLAFEGKERLPDEFLSALRTYRPAGVTLFRSLNIEHPAQVQRLTAQLQEAARAAGLPPLLIAVDQEGGQLMTIGGGTTQLSGNMALGATGDPALARRAGEVLGRELLAMGVNINYAPCADVNINPRNPVIGIRSFGEDPGQGGEMAAAMTEGIQSCGVAATAKHFPGHGDTAGDSHHGLPRLLHTAERLQQVELPPFQAAIKADTKLVMTAHVALPAIDGEDAPPATLSRALLRGLLRGQLGYEGVIITDAMDMHAIAQGDALGESAVQAAAAGADLLLLTSNPADQRCVFDSLMRAAEHGSLPAGELAASVERVARLKRWISLAPARSKIDVVGCASHQVVADEIARRSVTVIRDEAGLLPLRLRPEARVAAVVPKPADLTPADTSSYVAPTLASAIREYHAATDELLVLDSPSEAGIRDTLERLRGYDLIILGTVNAFAQASQATLASEVFKLKVPTVVVALRLPYDLVTFPQAPTFVCTYSILEPSMRALAAVLFGASRFEGRLPVSIPGLYPIGHALVQ